MRCAILSDIHGNLEALSAVLDQLSTEGIDRYLCLGDTVGYGADPEACLRRLQACGAISVCGNHEWGCLGKLELRWFNEMASAAIEWTRDRLTFSDLDALRRLPLTASEDSVTLAHGTLRHPDRFEYLVDLAQAVDAAKACRTAYCFVGHTHVPFVFEYDLAAQRAGRILSRGDELAEVPLAASAQMRYVINPGSVGQPRDGDPRASVAILDTASMRLAIRRVPYDVTGAQRKIREAGLPGFLAQRLAVGR